MSEKKWIIIRSMLMLMHVKFRQGSHSVQDIIFHFFKAFYVTIISNI